MTVTISNIFTILDEFITVKSINILIEICISAPEPIKSFMELFFSWSSKQTIDTITKWHIAYVPLDPVAD